jgi:uncharacterized protein (TIGR03086 family)
VSYGIGLLERAITYAMGTLHGVTDADLAASTPCAHWDLGALLGHLDDSLLALREAADAGRVSLAGEPEPADPVAAVRAHARELLGAWTAPAATGDVDLADLTLTTGIVTTTGALEIAVHGWDVAVARGHCRPLPDALATDLLELCHLLVTDADRPARFAAPIPLPRGASAGDRLLAFLGREQ